MAPISDRSPLDPTLGCLETITRRSPRRKVTRLRSQGLLPEGRTSLEDDLAPTSASHFWASTCGEIELQAVIMQDLKPSRS